MNMINALGLMSGTSLDGLDLCLAQFNPTNLSDYQILKTEGIKFPDQLFKQLKNAHLLSGFDLALLSNEFSSFCSQSILNFQKNSPNIDLIASHGHTVFHRPDLGLTTQIGNGAVIYAETGITTICDFRTVDVALGGQGAPLVPIGDLLLFKNFGACLNLGGVANISFKTEKGIDAQDVCFSNMLLNTITEKYFNQSYDDKGSLGQKGNIVPLLLNSFLNLNKKYHSKSLGREDFEKDFTLLLTDIHPKDILRTAYEYISIELSTIINEKKPNEVLVTGGGAHNIFLIDLLKIKTPITIHVPTENLIDFKEALVFAFLGVLRLNKQENSLKEVTGARIDNVGGCIYG